MPTLLLVIGLLIGIIALYTFLVNADPRQVISLMVATLTGVLALALIFLALTGRLPAAIAIIAALWPIGVAYWRKKKTPNANIKSASEITSRKDALAVLGLSEGATDEDIESAYKRLMLKVHPDQQGSEWMAAKLNAAREFLKKDHTAASS